MTVGSILLEYGVLGGVILIALIVLYRSTRRDTRATNLPHHHGSDTGIMPIGQKDGHQSDSFGDGGGGGGD